MARSSGVCVRLCAAVLLIGGACLGTTCSVPVVTCEDDEQIVIKLVNNSTTQSVAPNIGVCPNGMASQPHHFVSTPPVLGPGESVTYTTCELGGADGNCQTASADMMIGMCGWEYGTDASALTATQRQFGGQIGAQFSCGDTVTLSWSDAGDAGGTWTSSVEPATGNSAPSADFQEL